MIRVVFFDAVGTLIVPEPAAADVYHTLGRQFGSRLAVDEIAQRFRSAFQAQEQIDRANDWRTDEPREERRWRDIVATVLDDVQDGERCFQMLWHHFAGSTAWRCLDGVPKVLAGLDRRGLVLGMGSNFDGRLRTVKEGLPALGLLRHLVISSEVGWRKPASEFFRRVIAVANVEPHEILFVGDDPVNDDVGARQAGLQTLLLDASGEPGMLTNLRDLPRLLEEIDS